MGTKKAVAFANTDFHGQNRKANSPRVLKANTPKLSIQPSAGNLKTTENYTSKTERNCKIKLHMNVP